MSACSTFYYCPWFRRALGVMELHTHHL